jgi:membrane-associated phospholipid phosphatase
VHGRGRAWTAPTEAVRCGVLIGTTNVLPPKDINTTWYLDLNHFARQTSWAHGFMHAYALWAGLTVLAVLTAFVIVTARLRPDAPRALAIPLLTAASALVALGVNQLLSHGFGELRPYVVHPSALVLVGRANDFSFPSDHAIVAGALACGLLLYDRRYGIPAAVLALTVGFARLYVGSHYIGDVVGGLVAGAVIAAVIIFGLRSLVEAGADRLARTPLRPLLQARATTDI